jgi:hypothetical protein
MKPGVRWVTVPAVAVAGLISVAISGSWQMMRLAREHGRLTTELAAIHAQAAPAESEEESAFVTQIAALNAEIEQETARLADAQTQIAAMKNALPPMTGQVLRSLGRIEDLGRQAGQFIEQVIDFSKAAGGPSARKQSEEEMTRTMQSMMSWTATIETIGEMEDDPREIARLHATTIAERLKLNAATAASVEKEIARVFQELATAGLVRSKRPSGDELTGWREHRGDVLHAAAARIENLIPADQRQPWVVEQSLQLGNAFVGQVQMGADGHGSIVVGVVLPGVKM